MNYFIVLALVALSGLFSGLTLGFFSLNKDDLKRKADLGDAQAKKVYAIRKNGNLLLCTLLIGNVAVNSVLSIFLGSIISGAAAVVVATGLIVILGEIAPQATFSRFGLVFGDKLAWLVRFFMLVFFPICWPLAWILDKVLGDEVPTVYSKRELMRLVEEHESSQHSDIDEDEERIIKGALSFSKKKVREIMTPRTEIFMLPHDKKITQKLLMEIRDIGHSRIPLYKKTRDTIVSMLYAKDLIGVSWNTKTAKTVGQLARKKIYFVADNKLLDDVYKAFEKTKNHLFIVQDEYGAVTGIVTIEDVIEEIIGEEIVDEFDKHKDLQMHARQKLKKQGNNIV